MRPRSDSKRVGPVAFGFASAVLGIADLLWRSFAPAWQPIQAFGDVPDRAALAIVAGLTLLAGGFATMWPRSRRVGSLLLIAAYLAFACMWLPRVIGFPQLFGTWAGFLQEAALAVAAAMIFSTTMNARAGVMRGLSIAFALCVISFAVEHFTALEQTAALVPAWIPPSQRFWAIATGICYLAAAAAIVLQRWDVLAGRLLAALFLVYQVTIWIPALITGGHEQLAWAGNAINFATAAAAWIVSECRLRATA